MRAVVKEGHNVALREIPIPPVGPRDVRVRVRAAALCRTDLYVAQGRIDTSAAEPLVLGHEFAGVVDAVGAQATRWRVGDRVTAHPCLPCGSCEFCASNRRDICQNTTFLGVGRDGAFADFVVVPASAVHRLADGMPFEVGAFAEPVAASLAPLKVGLRPEQRGAIVGDNRIAELTRRVMASQGLPDVPVLSVDEIARLEGALDYIIETLATTETLEAMIGALRPGGTLILKSRQIEPVALNLARLLPKEPVLRMVHYGDFALGLESMARGFLDVADLCGARWPLEAFAEAFAAPGERLKPFFTFEDR